MKSVRYFAPVVFSSLFSFQSAAAELVNLAEFPEWFTTALARDVTIDSESILKIEALNVDTKVKGNATLVEQGDTYWYYTLDIGTGSPVECYAFIQYDGAATSLYSVADFSLGNIETLNKKSLTSKFNFALDSGMIGNTPYLQFDTLYNLGEGNEKVAGVLKAMSAETENSLQICMHNEVGYREAFFSAFESFVQAFAAGNTREPFFTSVFQLKFNNIPVGYALESYMLDADGDVEESQQSALLVPVDASNVARSDSVARAWGLTDGSLINGMTQTIENGAITSNFTLRKTDDKWQVEGQMQGKEIVTTLEHTDWLLSNYGSHVESRAMMQSDTTAATFTMWVPDADPTTALAVLLTKVTDKDNADLKIDMGPIMMTFLTDEKSLISHGTMEQGGLTMEMKRIHVQGEPLQQ